MVGRFKGHDVLILLHKKPTVKRWLADEDVELDEADQRVINKLSSDNLDIVKEYVKLDSEEAVPGYRKEEFALHDVNIEKYSRIKDFISRFELTMKSKGKYRIYQHGPGRNYID